MAKLSDKEIKDYIDKAHYYRGYLVNTFTHLEKSLENCLVTHFISDKKLWNQFKSVILDRMNFESKRQSLKFLMEKASERRGFIKTKSNSYPDAKLLNEIRLLNDQRNYFAHYHLMFPETLTDQIICLLEYRDSTDIKTYTKSEYDKIVKRIHDVDQKLNRLNLSAQLGGDGIK